MGQSTHGDIRIELQNDEDADFVCDQLKDIAVITQKRMNDDTLPWFNLYDMQVEINTFSCNVQSDRTQNGTYQVNQIIEQLKRWVKEGKIKPPWEFHAELLVQHEGWFLSEDEFLYCK